MSKLPKKLKACMLIWTDAAINSAETDLANLSPMRLMTIGWIVRETKKSITLAMDLPMNHTAPPVTIPKMDIVTRADFEFDDENKQ